MLKNMRFLGEELEVMNPEPYTKNDFFPSSKQIRPFFRAKKGALKSLTPAKKTKIVIFGAYAGNVDTFKCRTCLPRPSHFKKVLKIVHFIQQVCSENDPCFSHAYLCLLCFKQ